MTETKMDQADTAAPASVEKVTPAFGQWQPIETAPKDGTDVLLFAPGRLTCGHWTTEAERRSFTGFCGGECRCPEYEYIEPYWLSWDGGFTTEHPPTHWQPMPTAPGSDDFLGIQNGSLNQEPSP